MPSSRGSSRPRDRTKVSCIAGRFFTFWTTREAHITHIQPNFRIWPHTPNEAAAAAATKSLQPCPTLCDPIDGSPPGFDFFWSLIFWSLPGILQARALEWVAIFFSSAWKWNVKVKSLSRVPLLATPWTAAYQVPPPMRFSKQEYWSWVPLPSPSLELPIKRAMCHGTASWG